ncbi:hypothetical protein IQ07DRAFT_84975 [Pyrenochaeta sp. DS3sAY3a]|nr:hypothetical protein IQ07DRAFT_84975 [Pyrenochaeta sp. DS3sAY3a]
MQREALRRNQKLHERRHEDTEQNPRASTPNTLNQAPPRRRQQQQHPLHLPNTSDSALLRSAPSQTSQRKLAKASFCTIELANDKQHPPNSSGRYSARTPR